MNCQIYIKRLKLADDTDYSIDRQLCEDKYFQTKAKFNEIYILYWTHRPDVPHQEAVCQFTAISLRGHIQVAQTLGYQPLHCQHSNVKHVAGYISETHVRH